MKPFVPRAARNYLEALRRELDFLSDSERAAVLDSTREQIRQLPGKGRRTSELTQALGEPGALAARFTRTQPEALAVSTGAGALRRILAWPIFALALLTAFIALFHPAQMLVLPPHNFGVFPQWWANLLAEIESSFPAVLVLWALVPVLWALLPLVLHGIAGRLLQVLGAVLATAWCLIGLDGLGLLYIPVTLLLWAQVFTPWLMARSSMSAPGPGLLIVSGFGLAAVAGYTGYRGVQDLNGSPWLIWAPVIVLGVLALLQPLRRRWIHIALIIAGLLVIAAGAYAALNPAYQAAVVWPFTAGAMSFAVGHLALASNLWHERARSLLALL